MMKARGSTATDKQSRASEGSSKLLVPQEHLPPGVLYVEGQTPVPDLCGGSQFLTAKYQFSLTHSLRNDSGSPTRRANPAALPALSPVTQDTAFPGNAIPHHALCFHRSGPLPTHPLPLTKLPVRMCGLLASRPQVEGLCLSPSLHQHPMHSSSCWT